MNKRFFNFLKSFTVFVSAFTILFWLLFMYMWSYPNETNEWSVFPMVMVIISIATCWVSVKVKPALLFAISFISFFLVGYYLLGGNSLFYMSIGVSYLVLMLLSIALYVAKKRMGNAPFVSK